MVSGCVEPLERWEGAALDDLAAEWGVPRLVACARVGSTNDLAHALARAGAPAGTCVLAEEQTAGRGRQARAWSSPPGLGVWVSLVLRPAQLTEPGALPLLVGLAAARALAPFCGAARVGVKWPNDLLIEGRKLGGILCEGAWSGDGPAYVVAGIGINVLHTADDFPLELRQSATSLRIASGAAPRRAAVAGSLVRSVLAAARTPVLDAATLAELAGRDALLGRQIVVEGGGGVEIAGEAAGIEADGSLRVRTPDGLVRVRAGSVRPVSPAGPAARPAEPRLQRPAAPA